MKKVFKTKKLRSRKNLKRKISFGIITGGIISVIFIVPFFALAITNVLTGGATNITSTGAKISGSANPAGVSTSGYFRYSTAIIPPVFCNDIYGSNMRATNEYNLGSGNGAITFPANTSAAQNVTGLFPNTTYYYCAIGSNKNEIKYGGVNSFTTATATYDSNGNIIPQNLTASITTKPALIVSPSSAYLNGFYNSTFVSETWFEYRKKTSTPTNITGIATASTTSKAKGGSSWTKVGLKSHSSGTSGVLSFLLTGLSSNTSYQYRAGIKANPNKLNAGSVYGNVLTFQTSSPSNISPGDVTNGTGWNWNTGGGISGGVGSGISGGTTTTTPLTLGQVATPPADAIVRYHEGVETVFARQIVANTKLAKMFGYTEGGDLQSFAWSLADYFGRIFGYVNPANGREIRVSTPDTTAYELRLEGYNLTVYEYYNSKIINIQKTSSLFKNAFFYEYYFRK